MPVSVFLSFPQPRRVATVHCLIFHPPEPAAAKKAEARPTGPTPASGSSPTASEVKVLLVALLWESLATWVLSQCGVTVFGIKVVLDHPGESAGVADCHTGRGARGGAAGEAGVSTELFVSCVEAFAKPLERGGAGTKLAVRIEQVRLWSVCYVHIHVVVDGVDC